MDTGALSTAGLGSPSDSPPAREQNKRYTYESIHTLAASDSGLWEDYKYLPMAHSFQFSTCELSRATTFSPKKRMLVGSLALANTADATDVWAHVWCQTRSPTDDLYSSVNYYLTRGQKLTAEQFAQIKFIHPFGKALVKAGSYARKNVSFLIRFYFLEMGILDYILPVKSDFLYFWKTCERIAQDARARGQGPVRIKDMTQEHTESGTRMFAVKNPLSTTFTNVAEGEHQKSDDQIVEGGDDRYPVKRERESTGCSDDMDYPTNRYKHPMLHSTRLESSENTNEDSSHSEGSYTVVASNLVPGTTVADVEALMEPIAADVDGELLSSSCRLMNTGGTSVAEMVVNTKDAARHLVNMLDGIKADGNLLHVYMKNSPNDDMAVATQSPIRRGQSLFNDIDEEVENAKDADSQFYHCPTGLGKRPGSKDGNKHKRSNEFEGLIGHLREQLRTESAARKRAETKVKALQQEVKELRAMRSEMMAVTSKYREG